MRPLGRPAHSKTSQEAAKDNLQSAAEFNPLGMESRDAPTPMQGQAIERESQGWEEQVQGQEQGKTLNKSKSKEKGVIKTFEGECGYC